MSLPFRFKIPEDPDKEELVAEVGSKIHYHKSENLPPAPETVKTWIRQVDGRGLQRICRACPDLYPESPEARGEVIRALRKAIEVSLAEDDFLWGPVWDDYVRLGLDRRERWWESPHEKQQEKSMSVHERLRQLTAWSNQRSDRETRKLLEFRAPRLWMYLAERADLHESLFGDLWARASRLDQQADTPEAISSLKMGNYQQDIGRLLTENETLKPEQMKVLADTGNKKIRRRLLCHEQCTEEVAVEVVDHMGRLNAPNVQRMVRTLGLKDYPVAQQRLADRISLWAPMETALAETRSLDMDIFTTRAAERWPGRFLRFLEQEVAPEDLSHYKSGLSDLLTSDNPAHRKRALRMSQHVETLDPPKKSPQRHR